MSETSNGPRHAGENASTGSLDPFTDEGFARITELFVKGAWHRRTSYEPRFMGIPVIQLPEDVMMMTELVQTVKPTVLIECGVAHGGSTVLYASLFELMGRGKVVGVDIEIRPHNRKNIETSSVAHRIVLIEGSSTAEATLERVRAEIGPDDRVLVVLDSNHTKAHVAAELERYAPLVSDGSYLVVFDGVMRILADCPGGKPEWVHDNPWEAQREFLAAHPELVVDKHYNRLGPTHAPDGFLRKDLARRTPP